MKKATIVILVALLCAGSLFAASIVSGGSSSRGTDYTGFNFGYGITNESFTLDNKDREDKGYQLGLSINEFLFFDRQTDVGIYAEVGFSINTNTESTVNGVSTESSMAAPLYYDVVIGLGMRFDMDNKTTLLLGVGPELMYYSKEYTYYTNVYTRECLIFGIGADVEGMYEVGRDVYIGVGFKGSFLFYGTLLEYVNKSSSPYASEDYENYFGYRIMPRFSLYIGY